MKTITRLIIVISLLIGSQVRLNAQAKITLQHNGGMTNYSNLTMALNASLDGDTLYLSGGVVVASEGSVTIDKKLTIIGAGYHPDSSLATYQTILPFDIYLITGADGGFFTGFNVKNIRFGSVSSNSVVNNIVVSRCQITGTVYMNSTIAQSASQNVLFSENIINNIGYGGVTNAIFEKNIFIQPLEYDYHATYNNCIFKNVALYYTGYYGSYENRFLNPGIFTNCIIVISQAPSNGNNVVGGVNNNINNSLVSSNIGPSINVTYGPNVQNPLPFEVIDSTFISPITNDFTYSQIYHLKPTSHGHNAGTDGTDVGIYGTPFPAKDGAVPFNPHISFKNIGTVTGPSGMLNVEVKVSAQDR